MAKEVSLLMIEGSNENSNNKGNSSIYTRQDTEKLQPDRGSLYELLTTAGRVYGSLSP